MKGLVSRRARWATSPEKRGLGAGGSSEVAAEERGGRGEENALKKGAGSACPPPTASFLVSREMVIILTGWFDFVCCLSNKVEMTD